MFRVGDKVMFDSRSKINIDDPPDKGGHFPNWFLSGLVGEVVHVPDDEILVFLKRGDVECGVIKERVMYAYIDEIRKELEKIRDEL